MPKIDTIRFRCCKPQAQQQFYTNVLGMKILADGRVGYHHDQATLKFEQADLPYQPSINDTYWKIALAVPNIELAYEQLSEMGLKVGSPRQFQDIGYLAHFRDPEGYTIELIEHWFKGHRPETEHDRKLLGGGACLNLLTLRTHQIEPIRKYCITMGMTPLSIQPVNEYGFTLHFFAFTDDLPPSHDLAAVDNREWLYQRPYTVLEIQEVHDASPMFFTEGSVAGYSGTELSGMIQDFCIEELLIASRD
ncbi:VOC family protein [Algicola sagamiensis]|uniref:VOC family protein n=1 Tax=Algicola sagamiensis TaxID=163869 RepID=UPI0003669EFA|nr:VOC family protein [Algicola sagamiensis]